jgi:D-beta-D-heptose 7-phosphate kinase / D-beta-D-heptose 1-phosphate adenosyltransferase
MSYNTLKDKVAGLKVLVIGDLMIDHYMWGTCERISPEAPVPVVDIKKEEVTLGGAGNVLKNLLSFGVTANIISVIGDDEAGKEVCNLLIKSSILTDGIYKDAARHTSKKSRVLASNHQMLRIDKESKDGISAEAEAFVINKFKEQVLENDILLISDYLKGVLTDNVLKEIIQYARLLNKKIIVDPKGNNYCKYKGANIIKPNKKEAGIATQTKITNTAELKKAAESLQKSLACDAIIITLSEDGLAILDSDFEIIPTKASEVYDVTGAGDTVLASLGVCIGLNLSVKEASVFANHAAAIVVSKVGSAVATIDEVLTHIQYN